jgi:prolyl oligopeptidase
MKSIRMAAMMVMAVAAQAAAQQVEDPHLWLEGVDDPKALAWVEAHNQPTLAELQKHPAYDSIYKRVLGVITTRDRIPYVSTMAGHYYNFWTDGEHPRGIWRRTTPASYSTATPAWETVIDVDALAKAEKENWAWKGSNCLEPEFRRCFVYLSRGGADATEVREFDLQTRQFVKDGFFLPQAKSGITWLDQDNVYVSTDFGPGSMTNSGYARIVKHWKRGTPLSAARTVYEGKPEDVSVFGSILRVNGKRLPMVGVSPRFFETVRYLVKGDSLVHIDVPNRASVYTINSQIVVRPRSDWQVGGQTIKPGTMVSMDFDEFMRGARTFKTLVSPTASQSIQGVSSTENLLLVSMTDNVRGELHRYEFVNGVWQGARVPAPDMSSISVVEADDYSDRYFFTVTSFTQPTTLFVADGKGLPQPIKQLPSLFNEKGLITEQFMATSKDGTRVPYFVVRRENLQLNGNNPTLIYGYGGFEVTYTPNYSGTLGSAWLERGGVYVLAGIRGGGEFGPNWHQTAMKENRQRAYDDFYAVAEDLIARGITTPRHLGIMGGSNGGLLTGVAMTQRPELYNAVVIQVPLLDMRRYNKLLAGASWMAEYGDPDKPEEWAYISKYSPYQNLKAGVKYPRALITTTTRDDRVHPGHARKMGAQLEALGHPFYYFENTEGGHGSGVTPEQQAKMQAVTYAYLVKQLFGDRPTM